MKLIFFSPLLMLSFCSLAQTPIFEYLSITQDNYKIKIVQGDKFEIIDIRKERDFDSGDYRPLFNRINKFENEGWEFVSSNIYGTLPNAAPYQILMRRKKE